MSIKISIQNSDNKYENEEEKIVKSAEELYNNGFGETIEECIKLVAVELRGLTYMSSIKDENGNIVITFDGSNLNRETQNLEHTKKR